ncbi:MAG: HAD-IA family hydrolase [Clostridia bacterium]|nr:HAD-IA family hydrolase [Clostridia bacterium]
MYYVFDMDGVLVRSASVTIHAAQLILEEYGITAEPEEFAPFIGAGEARFIGGVAEAHGIPYEPVMKEKLNKKYAEIVGAELPPYPSGKKILETLREQGVKFALASSADMMKIEANLGAAGIPLSWFSAIASGEDAERKKPAPDIFLAAAKRLGADPSDCLVVEDAINGIEAARAAGMKVVTITSYFDRETLEKHQPDAVIDDLMELVAVTIE